MAHTASGIIKAPTGPFRISANVKKQDVLLTVVVVTFNNQDIIEEYLQQLFSAIYKDSRLKYEIIVADMHSDDDTFRLVKHIVQRRPLLKVMRKNNHESFAATIFRAWQKAQGALLAVLETGDFGVLDCMHTMISEINHSNLDIIIASRYLTPRKTVGDQLSYRLLAQCARLIGKLFFPLLFKEISDPLSNSFILKRDAIKEITCHPHGNYLLLEILTRIQFSQISEIAFDHRVEAQLTKQISPLRMNIFPSLFRVKALLLREKISQHFD